MEKIFTGVIQGKAEILKIEQNKDFQIHIIKFPLSLLLGLEIGASISYNGCCLTVAAIENNHVGFYLFAETLEKTTLGQLKVGDWVNLEKTSSIPCN